MDALEFVASIKGLFAHENPWVTVFVVFLFAVMITILVILYVWHKGRVRSERVSAFRFF